MPNKPVKTIRVGAIQLSVWENPLKDGSGVIRSVTITKSYKQGDEWKQTTSFKMGDLPLIAMAMRMAMDFHYIKAEEF